MTILLLGRPDGGGFFGIGIGEHQAKQYEKGLNEGGILVAVRPKSDDHREHVRNALGTNRYGVDSVDYAGETPR